MAEAAPPAAQWRPGRARDRTRALRQRRRRHHDPAGHGGDGPATAPDVLQPGRQQDPQAHRDDQGGAPAAGRRGSRQAGQRGRHPCGRDRGLRAARHRLHRRNRQGRQAQRQRRRRRCQPRGRAARPAAAGGRQQRVDQIRHGEDGPHPVHRVRRVPPGQAERPDPGAAGSFPDPRRAVGTEQGRLHPHPHRAEGGAQQAIRGTDEDRRRRVAFQR